MHVTLESIVQYATLGTLLSGLVSLVVWARIYRRQVNTQIFIEISARYAKLRSFPAGLWAQPGPELSDRQAFCSECPDHQELQPNLAYRDLPWNRRSGN